MKVDKSSQESSLNMEQHSVKFDRLLEKMKREIESLKKADNHLSSKLDSLFKQVGTHVLDANQDIQSHSSKLDLDQNKRANERLVTREF